MTPETVPEFLVVGRTERPHGRAGEVSVSIQTDFPERFAPGLSLLWRRGSESRVLVVASVRPHTGRLLVAFVGVDDADGARALSGGDLCVARADAFPAPEGFFYEHEIQGWSCEDAAGGRLGTAVGFERTPAGPLLRVETRPGTVALVPFVHGLVVGVDRGARRIVLDPPAGLLELAED
jgi:16S rRNA processing protein RimM